MERDREYGIGIKIHFALLMFISLETSQIGDFWENLKEFSSCSFARFSGLKNTMCKQIITVMRFINVRSNLFFQIFSL